MRRPGAVWLAKLALMLFAIDASVRLSKRVDLSAIFILLHNAVWFAYLQRSRRVQAAYGLESQA
jgi:hypothetical protein